MGVVRGMCIGRLEQLMVHIIGLPNAQLAIPSVSLRPNFHYWIILDQIDHIQRKSIGISAGAGYNIIPPKAPNLGASSNVVVRLSQHILNFLNKTLFFII